MRSLGLTLEILSFSFVCPKGVGAERRPYPLIQYRRGGGKLPDMP